METWGKSDLFEGCAGLPPARLCAIDATGQLTQVSHRFVRTFLPHVRQQSRRAI
jgi:hypothetical protein